MEFSDYLRHLTDPEADISVSGLTHLDGLSAEEASSLRAAWPSVETERRRRVLRQVAELAEDTVELNFDAAFFVALSDEDGEVRLDAIRGLWEYEGRDLIDPLLEMLSRDEEPEVRAEAALALGRYVLLSELGSLQARHFEKVERGLRRALEDEIEEVEVRARALESVGASRAEWVEEAILHAYESETPRLKVSAVHAMGRSCQPQWLPQLLDELGSEDAEVRYEAALALGSLADRRTVGRVAPLLGDEDPEVREAAIAAMGQIGGDEAKTLLRSLSGDGTPGVREAVAAALAEADFAEDPLTAEYRV
ncbi:MAG: HEAT repeat domain-containing protein [Dehalococcoidia bacterium]